MYSAYCAEQRLNVFFLIHSKNLSIRLRQFYKRAYKYCNIPYSIRYLKSAWSEVLN